MTALVSQKDKQWISARQFLLDTKDYMSVKSGHFNCKFVMFYIVPKLALIYFMINLYETDIFYNVF